MIRTPSPVKVVPQHSFALTTVFETDFYSAGSCPRSFPYKNNEKYDKDTSQGSRDPLGPHYYAEKFRQYNYSFWRL